MVKTVLCLRLFYKGKPLDIAKPGRGFKKKLHIGSNKHLFWQVLDPSFPDNHLFVFEQSGQYYMQLMENFKIECFRDEKPIDMATLKSANLLSGNKLKLTHDLTGTIVLAPDWIVRFEYVEPWIKLLSPEEKQIISQYSRRADLTSVERFNRNMVLAVGFLTIAFLAVYDLALKPRFDIDESLEAHVERLAHKVDTSDLFPKTGSDQMSGQPTPPQNQAQTSAQVTGTPTSGPTGSTRSQAASQFGFGDFDPSQTAAPQTFAVTRAEGIVAATYGGQQGGPRGSGPGSGGPSGPGTGRGVASSFDPTAIPGGSEHAGPLSTGQLRPGTQTTTAPPGGSVQRFAGDLGRLVPTGRPVDRPASAAAAIGQFQAQGVTVIRPPDPAVDPPEVQSEYQNIVTNVRGRQQQLVTQFEKDSNVKSMHGTIEFTLYINDNGTMGAVDIRPISGEFYDEFISNARNIVMKWRFNVKGKRIYPFSITFRK
ncbi:MAG: hypothetical protein FJ042_08945 [Candidatus Cloacimonetes bacterium]|nr:hypothetical protein [Candidatus Cloacimonadota bacterium]